MQRQLSDAQRELANKDDELATEAEGRLAVSTEHDKLVEDIRAKDAQIDELVAYQTRAQGIEKRLQDTAAAADELAHSRDQELEQRMAAQARIREVETALADAQARWTTERDALEAQHSTEIARLEGERRAAAESADAVLASTTGRMQKAQEEQLAQLRESHEKSVALLRGELEPKALEARSLAETSWPRRRPSWPESSPSVTSCTPASSRSSSSRKAPARPPPRASTRARWPG